MSNTAMHEDIAKLLATFTIEISSLPDDLTCGHCKFVLKNACQVPCGCRFCRVCITEMVASGTQFCAGGSQECSRTLLSTDHRDFRASQNISRLAAKCPLAGCSEECPLVDMEGHLRVCRRKSVDCPFRDLGCQQDKLPADEMGGHLQQEYRGHSEILIGMITNINRAMEALKLELELKEEQVRTMMDEMRHVQNENKFIKDENKSIKREIESIKEEKEVLSEQVRQLAERLERIGPVGEDIKSIKLDIDSVQLQLQSTRAAAGLGRGDASCIDWLIDEDVGKTEWIRYRTSDTFRGLVRPYTWQLCCLNSVHTGLFGVQARRGSLWLYLHVVPGPDDALLEWPFRGEITVTVAHRYRPEVRSRQTMWCEIERPQNNGFRRSSGFLFLHADLWAAGIDLGRGVLVSCRIDPSVGR